MEERDVVELLVAIDPWPAGTRATVIEVDDQLVTVEIVDSETGGTRGLFDATVTDLRVAWSLAAHHAGEVQDLDCDFAPTSD